MEKVAAYSHHREQVASTERYSPFTCGREKTNAIGRGLGCLVMGICLALTACKADLAQIRHENASLVLATYRARPIEVANNGRSELALHDCVRLALENNLEIQAVFWDEQVKNSLARASWGKMWPKIQGAYSISQRDSLPWSRSDVIGQEGLYEALGPQPGTGVTNYSTSERGSHEPGIFSSCGRPWMLLWRNISQT